MSDNPNIKIINDFAENAIEQLNNKEFDFILISGLIHELINPDILMRAVKKICTSKTIVHINVPNTHSFHNLWAKEAGIIKNLEDLSLTAKQYQRNHVYCLKTLKEYCISHGFEIIDEGSYFIKIFNNAKMLECLNNKILDDNLINALNSLIKYFPENGSEIYVNLQKIQ